MKEKKIQVEKRLELNDILLEFEDGHQEMLYHHLIKGYGGYDEDFGCLFESSYPNYEELLQTVTDYIKYEIEHCESEKVIIKEVYYDEVFRIDKKRVY